MVNAVTTQILLQCALCHCCHQKYFLALSDLYSIAQVDELTFTINTDTQHYVLC